MPRGTDEEREEEDEGTRGRGRSDVPTPAAWRQKTYAGDAVGRSESDAGCAEERTTVSVATSTSCARGRARGSQEVRRWAGYCEREEGREGEGKGGRTHELDELAHGLCTARVVPKGAHRLPGVLTPPQHAPRLALVALPLPVPLGPKHHAPPLSPPRGRIPRRVGLGGTDGRHLLLAGGEGRRGGVVRCVRDVRRVGEVGLSGRRGRGYRRGESWSRARETTSEVPLVSHLDASGSERVQEGGPKRTRLVANTLVVILASPKARTSVLRVEA